MLIGCNFTIIVIIATLISLILTEEYESNNLGISSLNLNFVYKKKFNLFLLFLNQDKVCVSTHEGYDSNKSEVT